MYKNQLQELAQRSCFNLPSYACIREGPDHAPRFKASVNFNGEVYESPTFCTTLRQAEHSAAEVALNILSSRGPSNSLTARILDETGVYKNLLQVTAHRAGLKLPVYTTVRSGPGHNPVFTCTVELAGMSFTGESAKTKKQAEKNAAIAAWTALKTMPNLNAQSQNNEEAKDDQVAVARVLSYLRPKDEGKQEIKHPSRNRKNNAANFFPSSSNLLMDSAVVPKGPKQQKQSSFMALLPPPPPPTASKILPTNSLAPMQQSPAIKFRDHKWEVDKEECADGNPTAKKKGAGTLKSIYRPIPPQPKTPKPSHKFPTKQEEINHLRPIGFGFNLKPSPMCTGGFNANRIAPAVQIRSVIPVCSAPPQSEIEVLSTSSEIHKLHL